MAKKKNDTEKDAKAKDDPKSQGEDGKKDGKKKQDKAIKRGKTFIERFEFQEAALKEEAERAKKLKITSVPPYDEEVFDEIDVAVIREPYIYAQTLINKKTSEYLYNLIEPPLSATQKRLLRFVINEMVSKIDFARDDVETRAENEIRLRGLTHEVLDSIGKNLGPVSFERLFYYIIAEFIGYGKIEAMMLDPELEDVSCDGNRIPIFVFHRKFKNIRTNIVFNKGTELEKFCIKMAERSGKSISIASPVLDATLPDGSRLNQTLGTEVTTRGSSFTIRKFKEDPLTVTDLVGWKTLSTEMAAHLWLAVQYGESMLTSGGTASGKTTTLNAISHFIPPSAKIITIEDTREMNLPHDNWIAGLTREVKGNVEGGAKSIDMFALLVASLRQRPEYMIIGEVRGAETMAVFQAMATGQTCYATIHADSMASIVHRLENPPINIPRILILGLNLVILQAQVRVKNQRTRRIKELVEVIGIEPVSAEIITNTVFKWNAGKDEFKYTGHSKLYEKIMDKENLTADEVLEDVKRRADIIRWMCAKGVRNHVEVASVVNEYYREPLDIHGRAMKEMDLMNSGKMDMEGELPPA